MVYYNNVGDEIMSKVQIVVPNYQENSNNSALVIDKKTSFSGVKPSSVIEKPLTKAQEFLIDRTLTKKYFGRTGRALNFLSETTGEIQNLWIMNVGTALIAPFLIANNPMSKEDKKTKVYTAWRQPLSAIINLAFALSINTTVPLLTNRLAAEGRYEKLDMSDKPPSDVLKARYNSICKRFNKMGKLDKKYFDLVNDGKINSVSAFKEKFSTFKVFESAVHKVTLKKAADRLLDKNNTEGLYNITLKDFLIKNLKFQEDCVNNKILNPEATESKLSKMTAIDFLRQFGYSVSEVDEKSLRTFVNNNIYKEKVRFNPFEKKFVTRVAESVVHPDTINAETITLKHLFKVLRINDKFGENEELLNMKMSEFLPWLNKNMNIQKAVNAAKRVKVKAKPINSKSSLEFLEKHAAEIASNAASTAAKNYGAYKSIEGIFLTLVTLPFSCGLLNWVYPRFMEKFLPNLITKEPASSVEKGGS